MSDQSRRQSSQGTDKVEAESKSQPTRQQQRADQKADQKADQADQGTEQKTEPQVMDAIRHVGPTLEQDERYLAVERNQLPENVIADRAETDAVNIRAVTADAYDREAEAMGAEPLRTRLPGDTSSDPHTNVGSDNATNLDTDRPKNRNEAA